MADFDYTKVGRADAPEPFSVQDLFASMSDMEDDYAAFIGCIYGDPGTRKTVRAMQLAQRITPADKKILYVYTGQGWSSLKNHKEENLMARVKKMPFIRYEQIETLQAVLKNPKMREATKIGTIVFDEYNRMQDMDIDQLTKHRAQLVNDGPKRKDKSGIEVYKDPDTPEWPEYNTTKVRMINLMNDVLGMDEINVIFVAHTRLQKKTGKIEPDFPQATAASFISMVHSIYYCDKEDVIVGGKPATRFPIELVSGTQTVSKNRIGGLPSVVYEVQPIADAFLEWNKDVLAKRQDSIATVLSADENKGAQVESSAVAKEESKPEVVSSESIAQAPDDKDSTTAPAIEAESATAGFVASDNILDDLFA